MFTISEGLKVGALLMTKLAEATKEKSDGGVQISKTEIVQIAVEVLTAIGVEVTDPDGE